MHIVIGGGSGFIGKALTKTLREKNHRVTWVSRHPGPDRVTWDSLKATGLPPCDVVVNLAGKHILNLKEKWNDEYKKELLRSRVETTRQLVDCMNQMDKPPSLFISTAGKCFYGVGEVGDTKVLDEYTDLKTVNKDFAADMVHQWEEAASHLNRDLVKRHARVNIGVTLGDLQNERLPWLRVGSQRGFLPIVRMPFCLGVGGYLGEGKQLLPWVHIQDVVNILCHVIEDDHLEGRFNAVSPGICTSREFLDAFAKKLRRKVRWEIPPWLITQVVGEERASILLKGQNVKPTRTLESGFKFKFETIDDALEDLVKITF
jgi:uncharacterized protein (TIGR01777 family)